MQMAVYTWAALAAALFAVCFAIPTSLIEDIKANELRDNKAKRSHEENPRQVAYLNNPTAIKRGASLKGENSEGQNAGEWETEDLDDIPQLPALYNNEQAYYAPNKDKLDEALQNAVSELYGEPSGLNQYNPRYYGSDDRKRKRRDAGKKVDNRLKREVELSPEEMLTILTLLENDRQRNRPSWKENGRGYENERSDDDFNDDEESWLNAPVYPHVSTHPKPMSPNYYYEKDNNQLYDKRNLGQWGGSMDKKKRFMVARKRSEPSRYYPGQGTNDYLALSQLLSAQREPNLPVYRRMML